MLLAVFAAIGVVIGKYRDGDRNTVGDGEGKDADGEAQVRR